MSAHAHILPWLEQRSVYAEIGDAINRRWGPTRQFEFRRTTGSIPGSPSAACYFPIPSLRCPSDEGDGLNNYVYCMGSWVAPYSTQPEFLGAFALTNPPRRMADITDGLSQTAAISERLTGSGNVTAFNRRRDTWFSGIELVRRPVWEITPEDMLSACEQAAPTPGEFTAFDLASWAWANYESSWYNHVFGPNHPIPNCATGDSRRPSQSTTPEVRGVFPARSQHDQHVNLLLLDGSVRSIADSIDLTLWRNLGTCQDGEAIQF